MNYGINPRSRGFAIENVGVKKLSHRFTNSKGQTEFMYYHRIIVNFKKLLTGNTFFFIFWSIFLRMEVT